MDRFDRDDDALESKEGFRRAFPRCGGVDEMPLLPSFMMCVMVFYWGRGVVFLRLLLGREEYYLIQVHLHSLFFHCRHDGSNFVADSKDAVTIKGGGTLML